MNIFAWIIFGLIAGVVAKWIMPGKDPGGIFLTGAIGIAGAFVGGFIGSFFGLSDIKGFDLGSFAMAIAGAILLLSGYRLIKR